MSGIPTDVFVHSTFDLLSGSFATVADRGKIGDLIQACLAQKFTDDEQLKNVTMNAQTMTLAADHNPYYLTALGIAQWLDEYMYEAKILLDGGADGKWALSSIPSTEETIEQHKSTVRWSVVLSGVLWIISMLSFVGENWDYLKYVALLSVSEWPNPSSRFSIFNPHPNLFISFLIWLSRLPSDYLPLPSRHSEHYSGVALM